MKKLQFFRILFEILTIAQKLSANYSVIARVFQIIIIKNFYGFKNFPKMCNKIWLNFPKFVMFFQNFIKIPSHFSNFIKICTLQLPRRLCVHTLLTLSLNKVTRLNYIAAVLHFLSRRWGWEEEIVYVIIRHNFDYLTLLECYIRYVWEKKLLKWFRLIEVLKKIEKVNSAQARRN